MGDIDEVRLVEEWVYRDLSSSTFTDEERRRVLDDLDEMEENLVTWGRPLHKCVKQVTGVDATLYRRREGDLRSYLVRDGTVLYCIGVGKRPTTYDRDLDTMEQRAKEQLDGG